MVEGSMRSKKGKEDTPTNAGWRPQSSWEQERGEEGAGEGERVSDANRSVAAWNSAPPMLVSLADTRALKQPATDHDCFPFEFEDVARSSYLASCA